jgi:hypothetical protein
LIEKANIAVIKETRKKLRCHNIESVDDARKIDVAVIVAPVSDMEDFSMLRQFLWKMYIAGRRYV